LGLELVELEKHCPQWAKPPPTVEENRDDREGDLFKMFLEESLVRQRNRMMDNFTQILQRMSAKTEGSSTSSYFGGSTPFKV